MGRQAATPGSIAYGLIGDGRVASHVAHYFDLLDVSYRQWSNKKARQASVDPATLLRELMEDRTHILILIKDSEIDPFIIRHEFLQTKFLIHCSGSLVSKLAAGYHPLHSFSQILYSLPAYESIPFVSEAGQPRFEEVFPDLPNPAVELEPKLKPYYHALCVMSGNLTVLVWRKLFEEFERRMHLPAPFAKSYLQSIVRNLQEAQGNPLTGPLVRRDIETIKSNLAALEGDPYVLLYRALLETVDPELLKEVRA